MPKAKNNNNCLNISSINDLLVDINSCDELATLARAISHPVRVQILKILVQKETCICGEIVDLVDNLAQSTVSQHLKILKEAGLIRGEVEGKAVCYCIDPHGLKKLRMLIAEI